ncbi:uncharacterized protein LOC135683959 [Rhopilema esculentum]|uniref:uncharacterized protein LOC135683959 n=1 Tax=Rhopilema esculentum TaxID=499914 RepID=UPI0031DC0E2C
MPCLCVVYRCSNKNDKVGRDKGMSLHHLPFWGDERPLAKKRRKQWVDFVKRMRANFTPSKYSAICSEHFKGEDFKNRIPSLPGFMGKMQPVLRRDDFGIVAFPSVYLPTPQEEPSAWPKSMTSSRKTSRDHRQILRDALSPSSSTEASTLTVYDHTGTDEFAVVLQECETEIADEDFSRLLARLL